MSWEITLILALQSIPGLTGLMKFFSFLGTEDFFLLVMPAVYWCVDATIGVRLGMILVTSNMLNTFFKLAFHAPRPYWVNSRIQALAHETSYGLPSGHAQHAVALWGGLAAQIRQRAAWGVAGALIVGISLSRIYLGVHFPTDVLGGWVIGAAVVWGVGQAEARWGARLSKWSLPMQIGAAFVISLIYLAVMVGTRAALAGTPDPAGWSVAVQVAQPDAAPINPRALEGSFTTAGLLFGLGAGLALQTRYARFNAGGAGNKRAARYAIGVAGALVFWLGLKVIFPADATPVALTLRYLRYALTALWVFYLAPWVFLKLKLAERSG